MFLRQTNGLFHLFHGELAIKQQERGKWGGREMDVAKSSGMEIFDGVSSKREGAF